MNMNQGKVRSLRRASSFFDSQIVEWTIVSASDRVLRVCFSVLVLLLSFLVDHHPFLRSIISSTALLSGYRQIAIIRLFALLCLTVDGLFYLSAMVPPGIFPLRKKEGNRDDQTALETEEKINGNAKHAKRNYLQRMVGSDGFWAINDDAFKPIVTAVLKMEGTADVANVRKDIERMLDKKSIDGSLKYQKLKMYKVIKRGYFYWRLEDCFQIERHVHQMEADEVREDEDVTTHVYPQMENCFPPDFSPWSVVLVTSETLRDKNVYYVIVRLHHSIADGISLLMMILNELAEGVQGVDFQRQGKLTKAQRYWGVVRAAVNLPAILYKEFLFNDRNCLHGPMLTGGSLVEVTSPIEMEMVKDLKNKSNTSISCVLMSCLCGSLSKYFKRNMDHVPDTIQACFPLLLQLPDVDSPLGNYFTVGFGKFLTTETDPATRLQLMFESVKLMKSSPSVILNSVIMKYLTTVSPAWLAKMLVRRSTATVSVTNVPGPAATIRLWGHDVLDMYFLAPNVGSIGLTVSILSYNHSMRVGFQADGAVITNQKDLRTIRDGFERELWEIQKQLLPHK